jgi:hypothetical protein
MISSLLNNANGFANLSPAIEALGWTLLHFIWQGAALGLVLACGASLVPIEPANVSLTVAAKELEEGRRREDEFRTLQDAVIRKFLPEFIKTRVASRALSKVWTSRIGGVSRSRSRTNSITMPVASSKSFRRCFRAS